MRYRADITAGSLKLKESRIIADLLLRGLTDPEWQDALGRRNVLQAKNPATATRLTRLIRGRLETMKPELWTLIRDGSFLLSTQALLACAIKHSMILGDFLDLVVRDQHRRFAQALTRNMWLDFLEECRERDPEMPELSPSTIRRMGSSVFQILEQAGYIKDSRSMTLQRPIIAAEILAYLKRNQEDYVLRCITAGT